MERSPQPEPIALPIDFTGADDFPVLLANVLTVQRLQDEFIVTIGQVAPVILGDIESQRQTVQKMGTIPVKTITRFVLTENRLAEFVSLLQDALKNVTIDGTGRGD